MTAQQHHDISCYAKRAELILKSKSMNQNICKLIDALKSKKYQRASKDEIYLRSLNYPEVYSILGVICDVSQLGEWEQYHQ